jgi:antitoxin HicB
MKKTPKYPIEVFWSDEGEGFIAIAPDLPGCTAWGASEAEALAEIHHAMAAWMQAAKKAGNAIPAPSVPGSASGKFLMRLPKRLHSDLARAAKREGVSLNQYVLYLLAGKHAAEEVVGKARRKSHP